MTFHPFQRAILRRSTNEYACLLAPNAQLHSPVLHLPFAGAATVAAMLPVLRANFTELVYTDTFEAPATRAAIFRGQIAARDAEGLLLLRLDGDDLVEHVTVMLRPMSVGQALAQAMATKIERLPDNTYRLRSASNA
ncbi:hypothetical protein [Pseudonocardia spinosispora]|uniref:hypothetical protein n=1 Tax=Pseudonocardia spinosispora TaxID=103441 RepID=UPI0005664BA3|nr:hypothetical protein [Pseudonocardia spinosispora]